MSLPAPPLPGRLVCSVLSAELASLWPGLRAELEALFGPMDHVPEPLPFSYTQYYDRELGTPLFRRLVGFARLVPQDTLVSIKLATNALEKKYARDDGRRRVNLDPGLVTQERLVLATGKNFGHRVYLGQGIFADLTLVFRQGSWQTLPWTFPDYASPEMRAELTRLRDGYREILFRQSPDSPSNDKDTPCPKA